jgi:hypothetical protein
MLIICSQKLKRLTPAIHYRRMSIRRVRNVKVFSPLVYLFGLGSLKSYRENVHRPSTKSYPQAVLAEVTANKCLLQRVVGIVVKSRVFWVVEVAVEEKILGSLRVRSVPAHRKVRIADEVPIPMTILPSVALNCLGMRFIPITVNFV